MANVASESLHKARAPLSYPLLMKWRPLHSIDHSKLSQLIADDPYQSQGFICPPPQTMACSLIYFRRWVMLSGISITTTLICPLELVHQYKSWMSPKSRHGRGRNALLTWCFLSLLAALGAFSWTGFLNNKFVWNELSASPQGACLSLCLTFSPSSVLTAFIHCLRMHSPTVISLRTSTEGEICNFKAGSSPNSVPALYNSPQFVFHKWICFSLFTPPPTPHPF